MGTRISIIFETGRLQFHHCTKSICNVVVNVVFESSIRTSTATSTHIGYIVRSSRTIHAKSPRRGLVREHTRDGAVNCQCLYRIRRPDADVACVRLQHQWILDTESISVCDLKPPPHKEKLCTFPYRAHSHLNRCLESLNFQPGSSLT